MIFTPHHRPLTTDDVFLDNLFICGSDTVLEDKQNNTSDSVIVYETSLRPQEVHGSILHRKRTVVFSVLAIADEHTDIGVYCLPVL